MPEITIAKLREKRKEVEKVFSDYHIELDKVKIYGYITDVYLVGLTDLNVLIQSDNISYITLIEIRNKLEEIYTDAEVSVLLPDYLEDRVRSKVLSKAKTISELTT